MKITSLKPGMIVYDVRKRDLWGVKYFTVRIIDILPYGYFTASVNNNPVRLYKKVPSSWRLKKPELKERITKKK